MEIFIMKNNFTWPLINNNISLNDKELLCEFIMGTDRFTNGPKVVEFEKAWSEWLGVKYSVMVNSGASANYITTSIVRELKGHHGEIIVPPIGWVSDISSVINTGFKPVFVDVDVDSMSISYENIRNAINEDTKAIVLVHALGFNGLTDELIKLADQHDLLLIEDCCESHGATHNGTKIGAIGDMSCFSFYFGHHMTTIEGGMISTNDENIHQLARMFRSHGMIRETSQEYQKQFYRDDLNPLFTFAVPGYNMRSSEINAVLGIEQLKRLDFNIQKRIDNLQVWVDNLDSDLYFTDFKMEGSSNYALPLILNKNNSTMPLVCSLLESEGVEFRLGTAGGGNQARQPYLEKFDFKVVGSLANSDYIHDYGLYIGNHPELEVEEIISLCTKLNNIKESKDV
jgi:CDP-4-dehydro-6-deoxyglucose reductase, E1